LAFKHHENYENLRTPHPHVVSNEGLGWVAFGFSVLGWSDNEILEREFIVYDALYAECRRRVATLEPPTPQAAS